MLINKNGELYYLFLLVSKIIMQSLPAKYLIENRRNRISKGICSLCSCRYSRWSAGFWIRWSCRWICSPGWRCSWCGRWRIVWWSFVEHWWVVIISIAVPKWKLFLKVNIFSNASIESSISCWESIVILIQNKTWEWDRFKINLPKEIWWRNSGTWISFGICFILSLQG